jgi:nucleotide-binding universal stress UspA family protein
MEQTEFKKIIVPYDGSKYSKKATKLAIAIAEQFHSKIFFLTVVSKNEIPPFNELLGVYKNDKKLQREVHRVACAIRIELKKILHNWVHVCYSKDVDADYNILEGNPIEKIIEFSKKQNADLIVMGSHGLTGLYKIKALGSVSRGISELAKCPVMIVRD